MLVAFKISRKQSVNEALTLRYLHPLQTLLAAGQQTTQPAPQVQAQRSDQSADLPSVLASHFVALLQHSENTTYIQFLQYI